ncbi:Multidrug resistance protein MdtG [subsurface metagenome]
MPLFVLAHFGHHLLTALPIPMSPFIRDDFGLDYTQTGLVISAFTLAYGIGQLPAGWLADRIGPRIVVTVGICGVAIAGLLVGLSQTYVMALVFLALMGLAGGGYHPSAPPVISSSVRPENRGRALGFHMIGGSASFFLAPIIAAAIAAVWGWRGSFIGLAIPSMVFGLVLYVLMGRYVATSKAVSRTTTAGQEDAPSPPGHLRRLVWFIILSTSSQSVVISVIAFIPVFLVDRWGASQETAAAAMSLIYVCGLWVSPLAGYLSDRVGRIPMVLVVCFMASPVIYLLNIVPYGIGIVVLLILIGVFMYVRMPVSEAYIVTHASERHRSTILGIYFFGSMEGGGVLTPVIGYLIDHFGFYTSFSIAAAVVLGVTLICSVFLWGDRS